MSSRASKGKEKEPMPQPWSQWTWDPRGYQYYRTQLQSDGSYAYEYQAAETPRAVDTLSDTFALASIDTLDSKLDSRGYQSFIPKRILIMEQAFSLYIHPLGFSA
jgi:hypothetical protein